MDITLAAILSVGFVAGLFMLVKGADLFIDGAASIAARRGVSEHLIGLTLVAFATSIPELAISDIAAYRGVEGIAIGNVVGSNIANLGIVLGIAILIMPVKADRQSYSDSLILLGIMVLLTVLIYNGEAPELTRIDGGVLLLVYVIFMAYLVRGMAQGKAGTAGNRSNSGTGGNERNGETCGNNDTGMEGNGHASPQDPATPLPLGAGPLGSPSSPDPVSSSSSPPSPLPSSPSPVSSSSLSTPSRRDWLLTLGGCIMVLAGAHLLVESSVAIASEFSISQYIIGLTIVSVGTSLPELASSVAAALKRKHGISVGNVIGSNIINSLLVLGSAAAIRPIPSEGHELDVSMPFLFLFTIICVVLVKTRMPRIAGVALLVLYVVFILTLAMGWGF